MGKNDLKGTYNRAPIFKGKTLCIGKITCIVT